MEDILKQIFISNSIYLTRNEIIRRLNDYKLSDNDIEKCLEILDNSDMFTNIDLYYTENITEKDFKKLSISEKVRYLIRNSNISKEYGDFYNVKYKYIVGFINNCLVKMEVSKKDSKLILEYLKNHLDDIYDSDRYIINRKKKVNKSKIIYNKIIYKIKNIYCLISDNNIYYCTRKAVNKEGKINFLDKNYYSNIYYDYYDIKTKKLLDDNSKYMIIRLKDIDEYNQDCSFLSLKDIDSSIKQKRKLM